MIEPLPLARSDRSPEVSAFFLVTKLLNAPLVVMPMSKHRPFTEYVSNHFQRLFTEFKCETR